MVQGSTLESLLVCREYLENFIPSTIMLQSHWQAFLIAAASSTDNFLVGISLGLSFRSGSQMMHGLIWGIAVCNAGTALATALFGEQIGAVVSPWIQNCAAGTVFLWLGWNEVIGEPENQASKQKESTGIGNNSSSQVALFIQLAVPMSLNNMAGGVASGIAGVSAMMTACYSMVVSVVFMEVGVALGKLSRKNTGKRREQLQRRANIWSCVLYIVLGMQCFYGAVA